MGKACSAPTFGTSSTAIQMIRHLASLCTLVSCPILLAQQIPNGGFEQWSTATGVNEPVGWTTLNSLLVDLGVVSAEQGTPGYQGSSFLRLLPVDMGELGSLPGLAVAGDAITGLGGFPWTSRSEMLQGYFRYTVPAEDQATVVVAVHRWDATAQERVTLGMGMWTVAQATAQWTAFQVPITYSGDPAAVPDSASISILNSIADAPAAGTAFDLDALSFSGSTSVVEKTVATVSTLHPSPTLDRFMWSTVGTGPMRWEVVSATGRVEMRGQDTGVRAPITVEALAAGTYLFRTVAENGDVAFTRFVKQ